MSQLHTEPEEFELLYRDPVTLVGGHSPGLDVNSALLFKAEIKTILIKKRLKVYIGQQLCQFSCRLRQSAASLHLLSRDNSISYEFV